MRPVLALRFEFPGEVDERYWRSDRPNDDLLETHATYSGFRRCQVTTGEQIKTPR
jgi:hypothetical protein